MLRVPIMENQMDEQLENDMEARAIIWGLPT